MKKTIVTAFVAFASIAAFASNEPQNVICPPADFVKTKAKDNYIDTVQRANDQQGHEWFYVSSGDMDNIYDEGSKRWWSIETQVTYAAGFDDAYYRGLSNIANVLHNEQLYAKYYPEFGTYACNYTSVSGFEGVVLESKLENQSAKLKSKIRQK